jgi:hypothetical protein
MVLHSMSEEFLHELQSQLPNVSFYFHHDCKVYKFYSLLTNPDRLSTNVQRLGFSSLRLYIVKVSHKPKLITENRTTERINLFPFSVRNEGLAFQTAALNGIYSG